ncbi:MAG: HAD-IC family P-type ATPase [bacterium]
MNQKSRPYKLKLKEAWYICARNIFLLVNAIMYSVVVLLFVFGATQAAIFLGFICLLNTFLGCFQDLRAWIALEKLQLLTAPRVTRSKADGAEEIILVEEVQKGDIIKLKIGDQIPCDSLVLEAYSLEVNEGLITGESTSLPKDVNTEILAGSIVTSGSGVIKTQVNFKGSRIARMTEGVKKYSTDLSPIQHSVNIVIKYTGYILLVSILFILVRGFITHDTYISIVLQIGALSSVIVPQGLIFAITLFFAYGAAHFYNRNVLLQEVNSTEKLGRIRNLCMDKTGTLTENVLAVESMFVYSDVTEDYAKKLASAYISGTKDVSAIMSAVEKYINYSFDGKIKDVVNFSSWRQYGGVCVEIDGQDKLVVAGSYDTFLPHIVDDEQKKWLKGIMETTSKQGKHVLCINTIEGKVLPKKISNEKISVVGVFVFYNNLREGIKETIDFFQNRGIHIRVISGDSPETLQTVALMSGIKNTDKLITGKEMEKWSDEDFDKKTKEYSLFARILPEQKEKIIESMKKDGFTAMVGDGANDALAIKKADLGIAMFDGAPATRQLASVVLTNNSFTALPGGVELADTIIKNIEIFASIFFFQSLMGLVFFILTALMGANYPFTPLNITFINYFTVGIPGLLISYWTIMPGVKIYPTTKESFLKRVLPFTISSGILQIIGIMTIYILSLDSLTTAQSTTLAAVTFIFFGLNFFLCAPGVYNGEITKIKVLQILSLVVLEMIALFVALRITFVKTFFSLQSFYLSNQLLLETIILIVVFCGLQYLVAKKFIHKNKHEVVKA